MTYCRLLPRRKISSFSRDPFIYKGILPSLPPLPLPFPILSSFAATIPLCPSLTPPKAGHPCCLRDRWHSTPVPCSQGRREVLLGPEVKQDCLWPLSHLIREFLAGTDTCTQNHTDTQPKPVMTFPCLAGSTDGCDWVRVQGGSKYLDTGLPSPDWKTGIISK